MNPKEMPSEALPGRHKHKITEAFVTGHVDRCIGWDLFELQPLGGLYHVRAHGPVEPFCFQGGDIVGRHFQKRGGVKILPLMPPPTSRACHAKA